ncbi:imidazoleglycerol-phosphate dehydratase/histidinol-phosphatase [Gammaproteobacteria bacterium]
MSKKILFIDRDGTIIDEPKDKQVDSLTKINLKKNVIPALLKLQATGYILIMVSNQNGIGTSSFKTEDFEVPHNFLINILQSQGIYFEEVLICPHFAEDNCTCRKPKIGLVMDYLRGGKMDFTKSYVIGDRQTDLELAKNMGIQSILYNDQKDWLDIASELITSSRSAQVHRVTKETDVSVIINLDQNKKIKVTTKIGFFDHMLEQLAKHGGFGLELNTKGDLLVDEHHTVEDTAIALGKALRKALGDKLGINRYGFLLPMDEALAQIALDLSGRGSFVFDGQFTRDKVGALPTEVILHFFRSLAESLGAAIYIKVMGENTHHMAEAMFKGVGRALKQAISQQGQDLPSTKGVL